MASLLKYKSLRDIFALSFQDMRKSKLNNKQKKENGFIIDIHLTIKVYDTKSAMFPAVTNLSGIIIGEKNM